MTTATATTDIITTPTPQAERHTPMRGVLMVAAVAIAVLAGWTVASRITAGEPAQSGLGPMESIDQSTFAGETGLWIEHVSLTGSAGLIEVRYRILDADKSQIVHDFDNPPRIIAPDGFEIRFQRHEHSHVRDNRLGSTYNEQLVNVGNYLSKGEFVTVAVGEFELAGVPVQ